MVSREELENLGKRILAASKAELYLSMRFMGSALDAFSYVMDLSTQSCGTDGSFLRYHPHYLFRLYGDSPADVNRLYLHMLLHCLFGHVFSAERFANPELYDLSADIMTEYVLDGMDYPAIIRRASDFRERWYAKLQEGAGMLTAEKIYCFLEENPPEWTEFERLQREFTRDDHGFWYRLEDQKDSKEKRPETPLMQPPQRSEEEWKKQADRVRVEMEACGKDASKEQGSLFRLLSFRLRRRRSYRSFLRRFACMQEEMKSDLDSFDYAYYQYGMDLYGNMPLIEENEYRSSRKIRTLVIAIDTSASCQASLVQRFLNETAGLLAEQESFFRRAEILIVECDEHVQEEILLHGPEELKKYAEGFVLRGGYGTDFRPVFRRVEALRKQGRLRNLKGMMYFTDGLGTYPEDPPPWETAFVLFQDGADEPPVPDWAYRLYLEGE